MEENELIQKLYDEINELKRENKQLKENKATQQESSSKNITIKERPNSLSRSFLHLFDHISDNICIVDSFGNFLHTTAGLRKNVLGITQEKMTNKSFLDFIHPEDTETIRETLKTKQFSQEALYFTYRVKAKEGVSSVWQAKALPIYSTEKSVKGFLLISISSPASSPSRSKTSDPAVDYNYLFQSLQNILHAKSETDRFTKLAYALHTFNENGILLLNQVNPQRQEVHLKTVHLPKKNNSTLIQHTHPNFEKESIEFSDLIYNTLTNKSENKNRVLDEFHSEQIPESLRSACNINGHIPKIYSVCFGINSQIQSFGIFISPSQFSPQQIDLLKKFADHVSFIMEKESIEEKQSKFEKFQRTIFDNMTEVVSITDMNGKFTYSSPSHYQVLGYTPEELKGKSIFDFLHPKDTAKIYSLFKEKIKQKGTGKIDYRYITKEGRYIWLETTGKVITNNQGIAEGAIFSSHDITRQKNAHEKVTFLSESGTKFLQIPTEDEIFQYIGKKIRKQFRKELIIVSSYNKEQKNYTIEFINSSENLVRNNSDFKEKYILPKNHIHYANNSNIRNGKLNQLSLTIYNSYLKDHNLETLKEIKHTLGYKFVYYIGLSIENEIFGTITIISKNHTPKEFKQTLETFARQASIALYRKEMERQYYEAKKKAEESDRLKSAFLANMSHEIRTPMNGILGFAQLLQSNNHPPEKKHLFLSQITKSSRQLLTLINDIIDISKIEAGEIQINEHRFNVNFVIDELYNFFNKEKSAQIELHAQKGLTNDEATLLADQSRLKQVMNNLLSNAVKFTSEGSVTFGYYKRDTHTLEFFVEDTGIGISHEQQGLIFDRFKQAENGSTKKFSGTGLGLAISKELIEIMGGTIRVKSSPYEGSTFNFTLPLKKDNSLASQTNEQKTSSLHDWTDRTILIVEDDYTNYLFLHTCLEDTNCKIKKASDGEVAVQECLNDEEIDVVLMDIQLPVLDGISATRKIKEHRKKLPVIAQTAYAMHGDKEKLLTQGFDDYLNKPIEPKNLLNLIAQYIKGN